MYSNIDLLNKGKRDNIKTCYLKKIFLEFDNESELTFLSSSGRRFAFGWFISCNTVDFIIEWLLTDFKEASSYKHIV